jgi:hypothetical protein
MVVFKEKTNYAFSNIQLKNKWDGAKKKNWRIWKKLISKTGV